MATPTEFEELEKRLTIGFPRAVELDELKSILAISATRGNLEFRCQSEGNLIVYSTRQPTEHYLTAMGGRVSNGQNGRCASFTIDIFNDYECSENVRTEFTGIKFNVTPGYHSLDELKGRFSDDVDTMNAVRNEIEKYFVEHPKPKSS